MQNELASDWDIDKSELVAQEAVESPMKKMRRTRSKVEALSRMSEPDKAKHICNTLLDSFTTKQEEY